MSEKKKTEEKIDPKSFRLEDNKSKIGYYKLRVYLRELMICWKGRKSKVFSVYPIINVTGCK